MQVAEIELYEILKPKVGEKEAKTLVEYIEAKVEKKFEEKKDILATKQDISAVKQDIANLEIAVKQDISNLEVKLEKTRADIIKWMFIFWAGQIGVLIAILQIFFRK
jgi:hypothetical protein